MQSAFFGRMSRVHRAQLPGAVFHITARLQNKEHLFTGDVRNDVERIVLDTLAHSGGRLISHTIMNNHFHLVLQQGQRSLGWTMQPLMRRVALLVQKHYARRGHVFERRFWSKVCDDGQYLRRAIEYTHMNPVRAEICSDPADFKWCSHRSFVDTGLDPSSIVHRVLKIFAVTDTDTIERCRENYQGYMRYWLERRLCERAGGPVSPEPIYPAGDVFFQRLFLGSGRLPPMPTYDLRDAARYVWRQAGWEVALDRLRKPNGTREHVRMRNQIIAALLQQGYAVCDVAAFFRVSAATVSAIASATRYARPCIAIET